MPDNDIKTVLSTAGAALVPEKESARERGGPRGKRNGTVPHFKARQPAAHGAVEAALKFLAPTGDQGGGAA